jgi:hypothetical protein
LACCGRFLTALELQAYVRQSMPWGESGSLLDERAWQVTAYVLKLDNIDAGPELNAETALKIRLVPGSAVSSLKDGAASSAEDSAQDVVEFPESNATPLLVAGAFAVILLVVGGVLWRRRARR